MAPQDSDDSPLMRPLAHEVDTVARRQVARALGSSWEHRELTGGDYGIDMMVEFFRGGRATGRVLNLQIKGTTAAIDETARNIHFDAPVGLLRYAEAFIQPLVLAYCPVSSEPPIFYFVWLQEYIRQVLNYRKPDWRSNKSTVRVFIPSSDKIPGSEDHLLFIAAYPRRLSDFASLGRIYHELEYRADILRSVDLSNEDPYMSFDSKELATIREIMELLVEAVDLSVFQDETWDWGQRMKRTVIRPSIAAADLLLKGRPYVDHDLEAVGWGRADDRERSQDELIFLIYSALLNGIDRISSIIAIANDDRLAATVREAYGEA